MIRVEITDGAKDYILKHADAITVDLETSGC
ncbi:MAG: hypothetical protein A4E53_01065 [Pelotomaculum sp. PtaB.Bin104]|nr:MAG: hypothetical protein A4E53_01065 [Pelotomaculum sp. PtaB.Bin104]